MLQQNLFLLHLRELGLVVLLERLKLGRQDLDTLVHLADDHHEVFVLLLQLHDFMVIHRFVGRMILLLFTGHGCLAAVGLGWS